MLVKGLLVNSNSGTATQHEYDAHFSIIGLKSGG